LRYDPLNDLLPIILIERGPLVLVVNPSTNYQSVGDVIKDAKAKPGQLTFASGGIGGSHQLSAELFKQSAGIDMIHVPYKSGAAGLTDLMGNNVNMMFDQMYSAMPSIKSGKLRPLAITSKTRSPLLKDVPTFTELGYPQIVVNNWQGLIAPKGTPKAVIDKLNTVVNQILKDPKMKDFILEQGNEVGGGTPEDFAELIKSESSKWSVVVKTAKIEPQ
jgi:tripartite-type tricarboxylate transporter receptor subunit TctC